MLWLLLLAALMLGTTVYGTSGQALTITLASLGNNSLRESTVVSMTAGGDYDDIAVGVKLKNGSGTSGYCVIWAYASADGGSNYSGSATGADAAYSGNSLNLVRLGVIDMPAATTTYRGYFSLARAFGFVPQKWGIIVENKTGNTISATGSDHAVFYQGVTLQ